MTAHAEHRSRRGRVLVVGSLALTRAVRERLVQPPVVAPDLFNAIGEVLTADAARPIVVALVSAASLDPSAVRTAPAALKRIDPGLEVVLVSAGGEDVSVGAGTRESYDGALDPTDPAALTSLAERLSLPVHEEAPAAFRPRTEPPARARTELPPKPAPSPPAAGLDAPTARADSDTAPAPDDLALIDAVMHDPAGVRMHVLDIVARRTGLKLLALSDDAPIDDPGRPGHPAARVPGTQHDHGWLASADPAATHAQLAPWADWIGRWLDLDASYRTHRAMAYHDDLTGAWNRRAFDRFITSTIGVAARRRQAFSVLVFDIDDFKQYNDEYGHEAGDTILRETVGLLNSVIRTSDRVCRIGGDEFAVILADLEGPREPGSQHLESTHLQSTEGIVRRFQAQVATMRFPKLGLDAPGSLSVSAGLATYPWDAIEGPDLLRIADRRALDSKRAGKARISFGPDRDE